ncbi:MULTISPECIES: GIY-YIG nuclease family protein [Bacillaceae]|uniref:LuxR family transcriptional regulator n=1 Tax=Peribacillus simplex TaxID=1478 RepID=A0A120GNL2_9BACI|nr:MULTISPECIES: GIY-YIG nuclease family protein [Bacillaceae]KWW15954.1 LuxR family transcriptional regulator [Peribacillus simplex]PJN89428.1 LuxR family transcriptional regulator [Bacillus sp. mrc49]
MDRKKELKQLFKETKVEAGIYQIKNQHNHKVFIASTRNLKTLKGKQFELSMGTSTNKALQEEWNHYGKDAFVFEVLEVLKPKETGFFDTKRELQKLEEAWLEKVQPYGERGYNKEKANGL